MKFLAFMAVAPLQIGVCLYLIYTQVGNAMFVGLGFMIFLIPIQGFVFANLFVLQRKFITLTDKRVGLMNELLSGIRIVKFYAWEQAFSKLAAGMRRDEIVVLTKLAYVVAIGFSLVLLSAPVIQPVLIFATYVGGENQQLDAATAFTTIALFNLMRFPFAFMPMGFVQYQSCQVRLIVLSRRKTKEVSALIIRGRNMRGSRLEIFTVICITSLPHIFDWLRISHLKQIFVFCCNFSLTILTSTKVASARLSRFLMRKTLDDYVSNDVTPPPQAALPASASETTTAVVKKDINEKSPSSSSLVFSVRGASLGWGVAEPLMDAKTAKKFAKFGGGKGGKGGGKGGKGSGKGSKSEDAKKGKGVKGDGKGGKGSSNTNEKAEETTAAPPAAPAPVDPMCLKDLSFSIEEGSLVAIVGPVGSGKSSLLAALTGEMQLLSGSVSRAKSAGTVALAAQVPWVVNSTLRENVVFGAPFDAVRYANVCVVR
jgi:ABC-type multidrug transport system fused ATPase/permease subunit